MVKKQRLIILVLMTLGNLSVNGYAETEIYKHVDEHGRVTYLNKSVKDGEKLLVIKTPPTSGTKEVGRLSHRFPKVDQQTQLNRDTKRRQILENELVVEKKLLIYARKVLSKVQVNAEIIKSKAIQPDLYEAKYKEKVKLIQNKVRLHERNIAALMKELANL